MGTALFTGVSALSANQRSLDVIASNIANVNTTGYRSARVLFQDLFSQTLAGPKTPVDRFGGTNPQQVGLGVRIASIDVNYSQGSLFTTGIAGDLAIQGNGFFILNDGGAAANIYTRDGSFNVDAAGRLVDPATGFIVQGFLADSNGQIDETQPVTDIAIPVGSQSLVRPTTDVLFTGNLDSATAVGDSFQRTVQVYDSLGQGREVTITFTKTANTNEWTWEASDTDATTDLTVIADTQNHGTIQFDFNGALQSITNSEVVMDFPGGPPTQPVTTFDFDFDFSQVTQLADFSDATIQSQNGFPRGTLELFNISQDGLINGVFSNGLTQVLGQVGVATFANNGGLQRIGDNAFRETPASGNAQVGIPNTGNRGTVSGGVLERSNVDLAAEFSNLIIAQRAFQANARTITTADTLLQETVNLIR